MFVHLGKNAVVCSEKIVAIIDWLTLRNSEVNRAYLEQSRRGGRVEDVSGGRPNSAVITPERVYLSAISSTTLKKRADNPHYLVRDR